MLYTESRLPLRRRGECSDTWGLVTFVWIIVTYITVSGIATDIKLLKERPVCACVGVEKPTGE